MGDYSVVEIAKLYASLTGIIAGFALTIVVLLIERHSGEGTDKDPNALYGRSAIMVFVITFFISTIASFMFAIASGEQHFQSPRAYLLLMLPSFAFGISSILLALGLTLLLRAYRVANVLMLAGLTLYGLIVAVLFQYVYTMGIMMSVMQGIPFAGFFWDPVMVVPPVICLLIFLSLRRYMYSSSRKSSPLQSQWFIVYSLVCIASTLLLSFFTTIVTAQDKNIVLPSWAVISLIVALSFILGWSILYIPGSRTD